MLCRVIETFHYADDGRNARRLNIGEEVDIRDDLVSRLEDEGKVRRIRSAPEETPAQDEIPEPKKRFRRKREPETFSPFES